MTQLVKYDTACRAIAAAKNLSEIKSIRDKSEAMRVYAKVIKNGKLEIDAAEIRLRAERRLGELIQLQKATLGLNPGAKGNPGGRGAKIVRFPIGSAQPRLRDTGVDHKLSARAQKLAAVSDDDFEGKLATWRQRLEIDGERVSLKLLNGTTYSKAMFTGDSEWYTPPKFVARVRDMLGTIELDPASSNQAQRTVRAERFFTPVQDGLKQKWKGKVFLNPPYSRNQMHLFIAKLIDQFENGNVPEAICLSHNFTDTDWFQRLSQHCSAICFTRGRIRFIDPSGDHEAVSSPTQGQAFTYFGKRVHEFKTHFAPIGFVVTPA